MPNRMGRTLRLLILFFPPLVLLAVLIATQLSGYRTENGILQRQERIQSRSLASELAYRFRNRIDERTNDLAVLAAEWRATPERMRNDRFRKAATTLLDQEWSFASIKHLDPKGEVRITVERQPSDAPKRYQELENRFRSNPSASTFMVLWHPLPEYDTEEPAQGDLIAGAIHLPTILGQVLLGFDHSQFRLRINWNSDPYLEIGAPIGPEGITIHTHSMGNDWSFTVASAPGGAIERLTRRSQEVLLMQISITLAAAVLLTLALLAVHRAWTNRKKLASSEKQYVALFDNAGDAVFLHGSDGRLHQVNILACSRLGYSRKELLSMNLMDLDTPEYTVHQPERLAALTSYRSICYETEHQTRDGRRIPVEVTTVVVDQQSETPCISIARDITERKQTENALRRWAQIFIHAEWGVATLQADGTLESLNPAYAGMHGFGENEMIGMPFADLVAPESRPKLEALWREAEDAGHAVMEVVLLRRDGTTFPADLHATSVRVDKKGGDTRVVHIQDITTRKKHEEEQRRLIALVENSREFIGLTDLDGRVAYLNSAGRSLLGWNGDLDSEPLFYSDFVVSTRLPRVAREIVPQVMSGGLWQGEGMLRLFNTDQETAVDISVFPIRDPHTGKIENLAAMMRDISDRRRAEEEKAELETQLRQAQKLEAIGTLAGGIAHDFNNILGGIVGHAELLMLRMGDNEPHRAGLEQILIAATRARDLIGRILAFSRRADQHFQSVDLTEVVEEAGRLLRSSLPTTIEIRKTVRLDQAIIEGDPTQMHQIIINLVANAAHAMRERGGVVEIALAEAEDVPGAAPSRLAARDSLELMVYDTGHGMDSQTLERIFEPYFTTKGPGEGTGLGLAVVHGIVENHGGEIRVWSQKGRGTRFTMRFLRLNEERPMAAQAETAFDRGSEGILLVDDEEQLVSVGRELLLDLGYQVTAFTDSREALAAFRETPEAYDLVITDQTMPFLTGLDLAAEILGLRPGMPIVLVTGFSEKAMSSNLKTLGIRRLLMKPFKLREMARTVREALDQEATDPDAD